MRYELQRLHNEVVLACRLWQAAQYGTQSKEIASKRYREAEIAFTEALYKAFPKDQSNV